MKNSEEILKKINEIPDIDKQATEEVVKQDIKKAKDSSDFREYLEGYIGEKIDFDNDQLVNNLVENYMKVPPYMGYCHLLWSAKKDILKKKYNIDWYTPSEENPYVLYD